MFLQHSPTGTFVVQVVASDDDAGVNGEVQFEFVTGDASLPDHQFFHIDAMSAHVSNDVITICIIVLATYITTIDTNIQTMFFFTMLNYLAKEPKQCRPIWHKKGWLAIR